MALGSFNAGIPVALQMSAGGYLGRGGAFVDLLLQTNQFNDVHKGQHNFVFTLSKTKE